MWVVPSPQCGTQASKGNDGSEFYHQSSCQLLNITCMKTYGTHASVFGPYVLVNVVFEIHPYITSQTFSHCWDYELNCMSFTIYLSIPPLMDIWIASFQFCLLQIKLQQPLPLYTCVCGGGGCWMLLLSSGNYWGEELLRNRRCTVQIPTIQIPKH